MFEYVIYSFLKSVLDFLKTDAKSDNHPYLTQTFANVSNVPFDASVVDTAVDIFKEDIQLNYGWDRIRTDERSGIHIVVHNDEHDPDDGMGGNREEDEDGTPTIEFSRDRIVDIDVAITANNSFARSVMYNVLLACSYATFYQRALAFVPKINISGKDWTFQTEMEPHYIYSRIIRYTALYHLCIPSLDVMQSFGEFVIRRTKLPDADENNSC